MLRGILYCLTKANAAAASAAGWASPAELEAEALICSKDTFSKSMEP